MSASKQEIISSVGARMQALRKQLNLERPQMAAALKMTSNALGKIENGEYFPNISVLQQLSQGYHISMDWLIFGIGAQELMETEALKRMHDDFNRCKDEREQMSAELSQLKQIFTEKETRLNELEADHGLSLLPADTAELARHMTTSKFMHYQMLAHYQKLLLEGSHGD